VANGLIRKNPIGRFALWDMRTDAGIPESALGAEYWDEAPASGNTGSIASVTQSDLSELAGTSGGTATGSIVSRANSDISALIGTQTATGTVTSRANADRSQLTGIQTATGTVTSRANADRSALTGIQTAGGFIQSIANSDLSALLGVQGSAVTGGITSYGNSDTSLLISGGAETVQPNSGGFIRRVKQEQENRRKLTLKSREEDQDSLSDIRAIVDDASTKGSALKLAYSDVKGAQKELYEAEQRLIVFLEGQELELLAQDEFELIKIIAELL